MKSNLQRLIYFITAISCITGLNAQQSLKSIQDTPPVKVAAAGKVVSVYILIDNRSDLDKFTHWLHSIDKPPFNRIIFSFLRPTFPKYVKGSLAGSGILGHFSDSGSNDSSGVDDFNALEAAILLAKKHNIQPYVSVGGWNYSCNYAVYGSKCGGSSADYNFDYFPDPQTNGPQSYRNLVDLVHALGAQGFDVDYEEFYHADANARDWSMWEQHGVWSEIPPEVMESPNYDNLVNLAGNHVDVSAGNKAAIMPITIDKMDAVFHAMIDYDDTSYAGNNKLEWASAVPAAGGRPIKGFVYGDSKNPTDSNLGIDDSGGIWWGGNLKGDMYEFTDKDQSIVSRLSSIGLMSYDVCNGQGVVWNGIKCSVDGSGYDPQTGNVTDPSKFTLKYQVDAYVHDYTNWLFSSSPRKAYFDIPAQHGWKLFFHPAKYNLSGTILQFGYEVNQPSFPKDEPRAQVQLLKSDVTMINNEQENTGGVIIWQFFSKTNTAVPGAATVDDTVRQSCHTFIGNDSRYDCNAHLP